MTKKRGLGKSLDALLAYTGKEGNMLEPVVQSDERITQIPIEALCRGKYQPRRELSPEALQELADSIRNRGIIQPIIVRPANKGYEIIAGERRWRAAQMAGLQDIPAIIRAIPDEAAIAIALIENIQRENLNPIEEAIALQRLIEEFGLTHQQAAESVGKSRASITNLLRLLTLPEAIKSKLEEGLLEMGHARALVSLPENLQIKAMETILQRDLCVRETEDLVKRLQSSTSMIKRPMDPDIVHLQDKLSRRLKTNVVLHYKPKGKGRLVIHYRNLNELDQLLAQFSETVF